MATVEFQASVENGVIVIPEEHKQDLIEGSHVKVTVIKQSKKPIVETDILAELMQNPVKVSGIRWLTREEIHDRNL